MNLVGKKVLVVGSGRTGISTARFCLGKGAFVTINDMQKKFDVPGDLLDQGLAVEAGGHAVDTFTRHDLVVISPGVSIMIRPVIEAQARGIEVISEIELAWRFLRAPLIAVTGTNGKTTTTSLIGALLEAAGKRVFVGGNIGTPLIEACMQNDALDYIVAEISSFQLEAIRHFRPFISVLLNVTDDHLDRHSSFDEYCGAKARIFMNQQSSDVAVISADDPAVLALAPSIPAEVFYFSAARPSENGAWHDGLFNFVRRSDKRRLTLDASGAQLQGAHNIENMLAAGSVGFLCGLSAEVIRDTLISFAGLPHRMEFVGEVRGVKFFNDSKGTNVGAVVKSLESLEGPIILIAGGKDKGGSYRPLEALLARKGKALVVLGEARERIAAELGHAAPTTIADSLEKAVAEAFARACPGDTVLFSPACASFDMFKSYAHRGQCFVDSVKKLKG
ncbi:MAG: UDP-N-acetylmuramoyl-L-alanine--D-glutamate ligase [Deltaproteobacteria bacterium]|nr:UDP-N-acetylmuramoyl-L-alanine--D-glutamate ligase [Deltaproteobacteria bacterium]